MITFLVLALLVAACLLFVPWAWQEPKPKPAGATRARAPVHADLPFIRAAVHEAGHAVADWCCTAVHEVEFACIDDEGGRVKVIMRSVGQRDPAYLAYLWCDMVLALAGAAAEAMTYGRGRSAGCALDFEKALVVAKILGNAPPPWEPIGPRGGLTPRFGMLFLPAPGPEVVRNLQEGYRMSRRIVDGNRARLHAVAALLLDRRRVTGAELEPLLGSRLGIKLRAAFGPRFVLPEGGGRRAA